MSGPGFSDFLESLGRPVAYYPSLAKVLGSIKAAVFLAQLMYWTPRGKKADGWVFKTAQEWEDETGLSYEEQFGVRKVLGADGLDIIESKYIRSQHTIYYRVKREVLDTLWEEASRKSLDAQEHQGKASVASRESLGGTKGKPSSVFHRLPREYPETTEHPAPDGAVEQAHATQGLLLEDAVVVEAEVVEGPTDSARAAGGAPMAGATSDRPGHPAVALYCEAWKVKYGHNPDISGKDAPTLVRLSKKQGLEEYGRRLERYLRDDDTFLVKLAHPPSQFENRWNSLGLNGHGARPAGLAHGLSRTGRESIDEKWEGQPVGAVTL